MSQYHWWLCDCITWQGGQVVFVILGIRASWTPYCRWHLALNRTIQPLNSMIMMQWSGHIYLVTQTVKCVKISSGQQMLFQEDVNSAAKYEIRRQNPWPFALWEQLSLSPNTFHSCTERTMAILSSPLSMIRPWKEHIFSVLEQHQASDELPVERRTPERDQHKQLVHEGLPDKGLCHSDQGALEG